MKKLIIFVFIVLLGFSSVLAAEPRDPGHSADQIGPGTFSSESFPANPIPFSFNKTKTFFRTASNPTFQTAITSYLTIQEFLGINFIFKLTGDLIFQAGSGKEVLSKSNLRVEKNITAQDRIYLGSACAGSSPSIYRDGLSMVFDLGADGQCDASGNEFCVDSADCDTGNCVNGKCRY